jgi:putative flippase GtrA
MLKEFLRYNLVGVVNTIFGFSIIFSLMLLGITPTLSNLIGYIFGAMLSYYLNSKYTFNTSKSKSKAIRFFGVLMVSYLLNLLTLQWLLTFIDPYIAQLLSMIVYTLNSFLLMKLVVFRGDS